MALTVPALSHESRLGDNTRTKADPFLIGVFREKTLEISGVYAPLQPVDLKISGKLNFQPENRALKTEWYQKVDPPVLCGVEANGGLVLLAKGEIAMKTRETERIRRELEERYRAEISARRPDRIAPRQGKVKVPILTPADFDTPELRRLLREARAELQREAMKAELQKVAWGD